MVGGSLPAVGVSLCQGSAGHGFPIEGVIISVFEENRRGLLINHKLTPNKCLCFLRNFKRSIKTNAPSRTKLMSLSPPRHQGRLITSSALCKKVGSCVPLSGRFTSQDKETTAATTINTLRCFRQRIPGIQTPRHCNGP